MDQKEKMALLEELFEVEEGSLNAETEVLSLNWDSLTMLGLIALLKSNFNVIIKPEQLRAVKKIDDILNMMN